MNLLEKSSDVNKAWFVDLYVRVSNDGVSILLLAPRMHLYRVLNYMYSCNRYV